MDTLLIGLAALLAQPAPKADDDPEPPRPGPVVVKLVAKKTTFKLDLQGMTADAFEKAARAGKATPIDLDMELVITNTSKKSMRVRVSGASTPIVMFTLTGPGVVESSQVALNTAKGGKKGSTLVILGPGQKATIPVTTLTTQSTMRNGKHLYFTQPGKYKLEASVRTAFYLDYEGVGKVGGKLTYLIPKARPIELTVEK